MVSRASGRPAYLQIADAVREEIRTGRYPPGAQLPTERALMETYKVSSRTARVALDQLRAEGLVVSYQGRGVFVRQHPPRRRLTTDMTQPGPGGQRGWYATLARGGLQPASRTTVYQTPCPPGAAEWLGLPEGTEVVVRDRIMGVAGEPPDQVATSYIPLGVAQRVPQVRDPNRGGLLNWLEDAYGPLSFQDVLSCRMPDTRERDLLDLAPGTPVLILDGATYDQEGQALQYIAKVIASDRLETAYLYGAQPSLPTE